MRWASRAFIAMRASHMTCLPASKAPARQGRAVDDIGIEDGAVEADRLPPREPLDHEAIPEGEVGQQRSDGPAAARVAGEVLVTKRGDQGSQPAA